MEKLTYSIRKRTALDGLEWFCVYGKSSFTGKETFFGKYKRRKDAEYKMEECYEKND